MSLCVENEIKPEQEHNQLVMLLQLEAARPLEILGSRRMDCMEQVEVGNYKKQRAYTQFHQSKESKIIVQSLLLFPCLFTPSQG